MGRPKNIQNEFEILQKLIQKAPEEKRGSLEGVARHIAFVKVKLDEAKSECEKAGLVVEYDNGGGQHGTRENPLIKSYSNLLRLYLDGLKEIYRALPENESGGKEDDQPTPLAVIMKRRGAANE